MELESFGIDKKVKDIIKCLGRKELCKKLDEGVLQIVKEFYANLDENVDDKVFVKGK